MLIYNSQLKPLAMPEYGRNIQNMVDHCVTIENRDERNHCARTIIKMMDTMFPERRNEANREQQLWDHLAIMSDFALDIDYPVEPVKPENLTSRPETVPYTADNRHLRRYYGSIITRMIDRAAEYPEGPERDTLVMLIANHMKKTLCQTTADNVTDRRVFNDLADFSNGRIVLNPETHQLHRFHIIKPQPSKKKRKR